MAKLAQKSDKDIRPPVVAVLGHIDHGKSTLIDYIRKTSVTAAEAKPSRLDSSRVEAGGITQHISAYEVTRTSKNGADKRITFIDTPGHEAFESIRTRCANVADIAVLIVSAEDGVKPQTLEAFKNIKECSVPYLVVITKIDKPSADVNRIKQNLAENEIYVEGYGGNTPVVELSAKTGKGVEEFLDMLSLMAELEGQMAEREALGSGVIIEGRRDAKRGITAVGIIKNGTVRRGLFAASSGTSVPLRFLLNAEGNMVEELSFSSPVQIVGWDKVPTIGSEFRTFLKKEEALSFAGEKISTAEGPKTKAGLEADTEEGVSTLLLVIKADTVGSLEAIKGELKKLSRERIVPSVILSGIGSINENDIKSALATRAIILGFNTKVDPPAAALAERSGIPILIFNIIYELTGEVDKLLSKREPKIEMEETEGVSKVLKLFSATKGKQIIGGRVLSGLLKRGAAVKITRRDAEIGKGIVKELQQSKIATDSAGEGTEFGAVLESKMEVAPGDMLSAVILVTR